MLTRCIRLLGASALLLVACSTEPTPTGTVEVQLATTPSGAPGVAANVSVVSGTDVIDISSVQMVARKFRLGTAAGSCAAAVGSGNSQGNCSMMMLGPILVEPPLVDGTNETFFLAEIPAGTYTRLLMQIHVPYAVTDRTFLQQYPSLYGASVRVTGTFNGTPFVYTAPITMELEIPLSEPLVLEMNSITALTMMMDVQGWFTNTDGSLIDPATTDQALRSQIELNIRNSFQAFEPVN